jgi:RHS repeat-associated protein
MAPGFTQEQAWHVDAVGNFGSADTACEAGVEAFKNKYSAFRRTDYSGINMGNNPSSALCLLSGPTTAGDVVDHGATTAITKCHYPEVVKDGTVVRNERYAGRICPVVEQTKCSAQDKNVGNPIRVSSQVKIETSVDWVSPLDERLKISRTYQSNAGYRDLDLSEGLGGLWSLSLLHEVKGQRRWSSGYKFATERYANGEGRVHSYKYTTPLNAENKVRLSTYRGRFKVIFPEGKTVSFAEIPRYSGIKKASKITWPDGYEQTYTYGADNLLETVTDNRNQIVEIQRSAIPDGTNSAVPGLISKIIVGTLAADGTTIPSLELHYAYGTPGGGSTDYHPLKQVALHDASGTFIKVLEGYEYIEKSPNSTSVSSRTYILPKLTKVFDGRVTATGDLQLKSIFEYDEKGRAVSTEHFGGADKVTVSRVENPDGSEKVVVVNPLGKETEYEFTEDNSRLTPVKRLSNVTGVATSHCLGSVRGLEYTPNSGAPEGLVYARIERNGSRTEYERDTRGRIKKKTEDATGSSPRVTTYTWDSTSHRLRTKTTSHLKETYTYDADGLLTNYSQEDVLPLSPNLGDVRTWSYQYTQLANGLKVLSSIDGPGSAASGVQDIETYQYDAHGRLLSSTDASGLTTTVLAMNAFGQPTKVQLPDNTIQTLTYDTEGRVLTFGTEVGGTTTTLTTFSYDAVGQLVEITNQYGKTWQNEFDGARRMVKTTAPDGTITQYTHDLMGNVTSTVISDASGTQTYQSSTEFDKLGRLLRDIRNPNRVWNFTHDVEDNLNSVSDPLGHSETSLFDALNRVSQTTDKAGYVTGFAHNDQDQMTTFTDPRNLSTQFTYNGFGEVVSEVSPDRGSMSYQYNLRGLVTSMTDARGVVSNYEYDDADRLTARRYPATPAEDEVFAYDTLPAGSLAGKGKIVSVSKQGIIETSDYDANSGHLASLTRQIDSTSYVLQTQMDLSGRLEKLTYPSGREILYTYDDLGNVEKIQQILNGQTTDLVTNAVYLSSGLVSGMTYGDGGLQTRTYDTSYRLSEIKDIRAGTTQRHLTYLYDARDDLVTIGDNLNPLLSETYGYTIRQKLDTAAGDYGTLNFDYDGVGNRITLARSTPSGIETDTYVYPSTSNRLSQVQIGGGSNRDMLYDAAGNLISDTRSDGVYSFTYDAANRLQEVARDGVILSEYRYNPAGQMVARVTPGTGEEIHVLHDLSGNRIAEYDATTGQVLIEYIWLDDSPVAAVSGGQVFYLRTDHIGRPDFATDSSGAVVSDTSYKPFGAVHQQSGTGFGLRFPGQVYHWETALHQNWMRDYDPSTGRYIQADPLGLVDGASVYGYALQSPGRYVDPRGEQSNSKSPPRSRLRGPGMCHNQCLAALDDVKIAKKQHRKINGEATCTLRDSPAVLLSKWMKWRQECSARRNARKYCDSSTDPNPRGHQEEIRKACGHARDCAIKSAAVVVVGGGVGIGVGR